MLNLRKRLPTIAGLLIVCVLTIYGALFTALGFDPLHGAEVRSPDGGTYWVNPESLKPFAHYEALSAGFKLFVAAALILIIVLWEKRPLSTVGLRSPCARDLLAALGATILFYIVGEAMAYILPVALANPRYVAALFALPLPIRTLMVGAACFCEELMYRGYLIERVEELTRSRVLAAVVSSLMFGFAHVSGYGVGYVVSVAAVGAVYAGLYLWRRNLPACMLVHFITDSQVIWVPLLHLA